MWKCFYMRGEKASWSTPQASNDIVVGTKMEEEASLGNFKLDKVCDPKTDHRICRFQNFQWMLPLPFFRERTDQ